MKRGVKTLLTGIGLGLPGLLGFFTFPIALVIPVALMADTDETRFLGPGSVEIDIEKPGTYTLDSDNITVFEGRSYNLPPALPDGLEIRILDSEGRELMLNGQPQENLSTTGTSSDAQPVSSMSIGHVEVDQPGRFTIDVRGNAQPRVFSLERSMGKEFLGWMAIAFVIPAVTSLVGVILAIWGLVKLFSNPRVEPAAPPPLLTHKDGFHPWVEGRRHGRHL